MYAPPKNKRQRATKQRFFDTLLELLSTRPMSAISVSVISEHSEHSRQAFYRYYDDVFALFRAMQDDLFAGFTQQLQGVPANIFAITPVLVHFADANRDLVRASYANRDEGNFIDRVVEYLYVNYREDWERANPLMSRENVDILFHYVVSGLIGVVRLWLFEKPYLDAEEVIASADYLMRLSTPGTPPVILADRAAANGAANGEASAEAN
jgi:AcrR family transcriptional regulator